MLSSRTRWNRTQNRLAGLVAERRRARAPLFDLTVSNPTAVGLTAPHDLLRQLGDPAVAGYDPLPRGSVAAREAVARDYARRGQDVGVDRLVLTASTSEAYAWLFKLLCDPGDAVLVPRPSYPLFDFLASLESVEVEPYALAFDGAWHLDLAALAAARSPRTRAVVVVNPNNPTGSCLREAEAAALDAFAAAHDLAVISDEVFADFLFEPAADRVACLATDGAALTFSMGGLSKSCALPQLKLGWIAASGPPALRDEALARLEIVADTYLSVSTPAQHAAPAILARLPELQRPVKERLRENRAALAAALGADAAASLLPADGGWTAVLRIPATLPEEERVCALAEHDGVLVHPGYFFDFPGEAYLVLSLLPEPELFAEGVARLLRRVV
jgi:aspartate/methionine/tyrosine aminotransferase